MIDLVKFMEKTIQTTLWAENKKDEEIQNEEANLNNLNSGSELKKSRIGAEEIQAEAEQLIKKGKDANEKKGLFKVRTASQWMEISKKRPIPKMLFSEFWYQGELCILFSDTNLGKSCLAVQIADSISKGGPIQKFKMQAERQPVLYFDFELSDKQFEARYSCEYISHYSFDENFLRAEIDPEKSDYKEFGFENFEKHLYDSLEKSIIESEAKVLIIDNITYLKDETEKAKFALPLMKHLQGLKKDYGLSILALAHTPKRDLSKPITRNDLQGSKMLINICDSSFTIGESNHDKSLRYIKQIKARNTEIIYDNENICICKIGKPHNFLQFEFLDFGMEQEHLKAINGNEQAELENKIRDILQTNPDIKAYAIAKELCKDGSKFNSFKVKVNRIVKRIRNTQ